MKKDKKMKKPSLKKFALTSIGLLIGGFILAVDVTPALFLLAPALITANFIRTKKKGDKYYKLLEEGKIQESEEKEGLFSKIKNKVKSLGKKKDKKGKNKLDSKNIKVAKLDNNDKLEIDDKKELKKPSSVEKNTSNNIQHLASNKKIEELENKKQQLKNFKDLIIDGKYGLKKEQIIQDKFNIREINNYYKKYNNNKSANKNDEKIYKKVA